MSEIQKLRGFLNKILVNGRTLIFQVRRTAELCGVKVRPNRADQSTATMYGNNVRQQSTATMYGKNERPTSAVNISGTGCLIYMKL